MPSSSGQFVPIVDYLRALSRFAGRRRVVLVLGLMLASALVEGLGLLLLVPILNALDAQGNAVLPLAVLGQLGLSLGQWLAVFVLLVTGRAVIAGLRDTQNASLRAEFVGHLRVELYAAMASSEWRFLSGVSQTELFHLLTMAMNEISFGTYLLLQMLVNLVMAGGALTVAFLLSPILTLVASAAGGLLWLTQRQKLRRAHDLGQQFTDQNQAIFGNAADFFGGLKLIKSAGAEQLQLTRFATETRDFCKVQRSFYSSQASSRAIQTVASALLIAVLLLFSVQGLHLAKAELLLILLILARLLPLANQLHTDLQQILHMLPTFSSERQWLARCLAAAEEGLSNMVAGPVTVDGTPVGEAIAFKRDIALSGVTYRHNAGRAPVLRGVDLHIRYCQTTALVGVSGAGKTTLADVILGLLSPQVGAIEIDGVPLSPAQRLAWRQSAAYVPQEPFLFPGTVRSNLLWANPPATDAQLWEMLALAAAAAFVAALPQGLDTPVGERGMRLSGGERQRLALARALLRHPRLLVLDEATSHLDSESEQHIQAALEKLQGHLTLIIIAHRLSTIRHADQIVVLEQGQIIETGDWSALIRSGGRFNEILQASLNLAPAPQKGSQGEI